MNNYPVLAPRYTWFAPTNTSVKRANITEIEIVDEYIPDSSVEVVDSWDASNAKDGSITCYVIGTKLIIAGNGSGKIEANADFYFGFSNMGTDQFTAVQYFRGLDKFDTQNVTSFGSTFYNCSSLQELDLSNFNTQNATMMGAMFYKCSSLQELDLSNFVTSKVTNIQSIFAKCSNLMTLNLGDFDTSGITNTFQMFMDCASLKTIIFSKLDTTHITVFDRMFYGCVNLKKIITPEWIVSNANSMSCMFGLCSSLEELDVSQWDVGNVTNMSFMFYECSSLGEIDVSNWDVSKVTNFDHFAAHANLKRKGIENWKTTSATNMNALFHNCAEEELDLSGWDVSKVQFFCQMFENSPNLKRIKGLENWDTSAGVGFDGMFERCSKLEEVDLSSFNTTKAKNGVSASTNSHKTATMKDMFLSCNNLKKVKVGENFSINGDGTNTAAANKFILPTPSADYIEGADGNWYTFTSQDYAPNAIPDRTYNTYYASKDLIRNLSVRINNGTILDIVEAVREKVPNLEPTLLSDLDDIIRNI